MPNTSSTYTVTICQIGNPRLGDTLTCLAEDSGGFRCESTVPDHGSNHVISDHTLAHAMAGNGYPCSAIN